MRIRPIISLIALSLILSASVRGATGFYFDSTVLYQPDEPLRTRLASAAELAAYMKRIEASCSAFFAAETTPERLDIVVGLKPAKKVRVWFVSSRRSGQDKALIALRKKLETVPPCAVHGGPIAFAMRCTIAGGGPAPKEKGAFQPPMPKEWRDATAGKPVLIPDGIFERIWRD